MCAYIHNETRRVHSETLRGAGGRGGLETAAGLIKNGSGRRNKEIIKRFPRGRSMKWDLAKRSLDFTHNELLRNSAPASHPAALRVKSVDLTVGWKWRPSPPVGFPQAAHERPPSRLQHNVFWVNRMWHQEFFFKKRWLHITSCWRGRSPAPSSSKDAHWLGHIWSGRKTIRNETFAKMRWQRFQAWATRLPRKVIIYHHLWSVPSLGCAS